VLQPEANSSLVFADLRSSSGADEAVNFDEAAGTHRCEIEGQLSWTSFFARHAVALSLLLTSVILPFWSIKAGPAKRLIADALALLVGTASLMHLSIWLAALVTRFRLAEGTLAFSRVGRRSRVITTSEVVAVHEDSGSSAGASIWLRDGSTLAVQYDHLAHSRELVAALRDACATDALIEGGLNRIQIARTVVYQWVASCLLLAIALLGGMCLAVFLQPKNLVADPIFFLLLGCTLLFLCAAGFYSSVVRYWTASARWFQWDGT